MEKKVKNKNIEIIKDVLRQYIKEKGFRNTPERYTILEEIYNYDHHFNVDDLYLLMVQKKYQVSKATIYNTIEVFLDAGLVRKHQFGEGTTYEKSYFDKQHDHIILTDTGEVMEFCDPRIQSIKKTIEEIFNIDIQNHSLYFYGTKKNKENEKMSSDNKEQ